MAHVVALVTDGELAAAFARSAEAAGHDLDVCTGEAEAWDACEERTELLVVDASSDSVDSATLVDSMRAGGELERVRTLALHADDDPDAKARAEEVGFDLVVPRSRMEAEGGELIARLLGAA
jgi:PleD family two-component response regulator